MHGLKKDPIKGGIKRKDEKVCGPEPRKGKTKEKTKRREESGTKFT